MPLQLRRGTTSQIATIVPAAGELIYNVETGAISVGNGEDAGGTAVINITPVEIAQYTANALIDGAHSGITYEFVGGVINSVVVPDLSNYAGTIEADAFRGTLVGDDSTILVDGLANKVNLDGTVKGRVVADANNQYDIGTSGLKFKDAYLGGNLYIGSATITNPSSGIIDLPAGSTVDGVLIGSGGGGSGTLNNVVEDTSPQLGGNLDLNSYEINGTGTIDITGAITSSGTITGLQVSANSNGAGTNYMVGDDVYIGDINVINTMIVKGQQDASKGYIIFGNNDTTATLGRNGAGPLTYAGDFSVSGTITSTDGLGANLPLNGKSITGTGDINITGSITASTGLGGNLPLSGHDITGVGNINITGDATVSSVISSIIATPEISTGVGIYTLAGNDFSTNYHSGTMAAPTTMAAGDAVGTVSIKAYNGTDYVLAGGMFAVLDATAVLSSDYPASSVNLIAGNNTDPVVATLDKAGTFSAPTLKVGSYTSTPDTRPTGEIGMIVYDTTTNKFQGYASTGWVDLS